MKTLIFGAGLRGKTLFKELSKNDEYEVVGFVDNNTAFTEQTLYDLPIYTPDRIMSGGVIFDNIYIAVKDEAIKEEIYKQLLDMGLHKTKILKWDHYVDEDSKEKRIELLQYYAEWLSDTPGSTAECGVFQGHFAKEINRVFYDRKLYLFDTFEGFDLRDIQAERALKNELFENSALNEENWFSSTSIDMVMNKMQNPKNVVIKKGYVPETFAGIEDSFCFVNLDMDLYQPMLAGLKFFWERMSPGGIILCHDYLKPHLEGVRKAVIDFENHLGHRVIKDLPMDNCSIAVFKTF